MKDELIPENVKQELENNPYVKNNKINHIFVLKNFGNCVDFLNELLQTEGIIPLEHETLREISIKKYKWESKASHWSVFLYGSYHLYKTFGLRSTSGRMMMLFAYIFVCFDVSYNLGRCFGSFCTLPGNVNRLMSLREGKSINAIQTRLFVKRCVYEEMKRREDKDKSASNKLFDFSNSYFLHQLFDKPIGRIKKYQKSIVNLFNANFNPNFMRGDQQFKNDKHDKQLDKKEEEIYANPNKNADKIKIK